MKDAYYFPHDSNAFNDPKIVKMVMELGNEAYCIYWVIIEHLRNEEGYTLHSEDFSTIAFRCRCDEAKVEQIVSKYKLFVLEKDGHFYSTSLLKRMERLDEIKEKRQEAGRLGGLASSNARAKSKQRLNSAQVVKHSKVKHSKVNKSDFFFNSLWTRYPNKDGRKSAERHFLASVKTEKDFADINKALDNYLLHVKDTDPKYIKNGSTWFNNWQDWVDFKAVEDKNKPNKNWVH